MHEILLQTGWEGRKINRSTIDAAFASVGVTAENLRLHLATGEALGLWIRSDGGTRRGTVRILPSPRQDQPSIAPALA